MPGGRPPKPTTLKLIDGTLRTDRVVENEMMPSSLDYAPSAPKDLSKLAKKEWKSVCQELINLGMLHRVDLGLLASYCHEMDTYWEAVRRIKEEGAVMTIETKYDSYQMQSPWVAIKNTALKNAQGLANQFGFTPSARSKINSMPKEEDNPLSQLLKAKLDKRKNENKQD